MAWSWTLSAVTMAGVAAGVALGRGAGVPAAGSGLMWLLFVGSSVHVAATGWVGVDATARRVIRARRGRLAVLPVAVTVVSVLADVALPATALSWLLLGFFSWQLVHYQKQNLGLAALAARALGAAPLREWERRWILLAGLGGVVAAVGRPGLFQLPHLWSEKVVLEGMAAVIVGGSAASGLVVFGRRRGPDRPGPLTAAYAGAVLFPIPLLLFHSPYAAVGGLTIAHGLQYLFVIGSVAAGRRQGSARMMDLAGLLVVAGLGGTALNVTSHLHRQGGALRAIFGLYLGVVMSHFLIDGGLWRMRETASRDFVTARLPLLAGSRLVLSERDGS